MSAPPVQPVPLSVTVATMAGDVALAVALKQHASRLQRSALLCCGHPGVVL